MAAVRRRGAAVRRRIGAGTGIRPLDLPARALSDRQPRRQNLLALLQRATVVLCPDSGPAHMATAVGTPVVGLYATSNRHRTGPYRSQHLVADRYPQAVERTLGKSVDEIRWGRRVRDPGAMDLIAVVDVTDRLAAAFREQGVA